MTSDTFKSLTERANSLVVVTIAFYLLLQSTSISLLLLGPSLNSVMTLTIGALIGMWGVFMSYFHVKSRAPVRPGTALLVLFLVTIVISSLLNLEYGIFGNLRAFGWSLFFVSSVYLSIPSLIGKNGLIRKNIKVISSLGSLLWCLLLILSFSVYAYDYSTRIPTGYGGMAALGLYADRLWGVFKDPNITAVLASIFSLVSIYLVARPKRGESSFVRHMATLIVLLSVVYIILSGSRTGIICLVIGVLTMMSVSIYAPKGLLAHISRRAKNFTTVASIIIVAATPVALVGNYFLNHDNSARYGQVGDFSNGRLKIWGEYIEVFEDNAAVGVSPGGKIDYLTKEMEGSYIEKRQYSVHNGYLDIAVSTGIPGILIFMGFLAITIRNMYNNVVSSGDSSVALMAAVFVVMLASMALLSNVAFQGSLAAFLFFTVTGIINHRFDQRGKLGEK